MTDTDKITNGPAQQVEVPIVKVTDTGDDAKSVDKQTEEAARKVFDATRKPVADASVSAADGSATSVAGS